MGNLEIPCIDRDGISYNNVWAYCNYPLKKIHRVSCYKEVSGTCAKGFYSTIRETHTHTQIVVPTHIHTQDRAKGRQRHGGGEGRGGL